MNTSEYICISLTKRESGFDMIERFRAHERFQKLVQKWTVYVPGQSKKTEKTRASVCAA